jgi:hypothetical protein
MGSVKDYARVGSSFKTNLSPAVRKALVEYWGSEEIIDQPEIIAEFGADGVSRINRIGRKSTQQIAHALESFGYIPSSHIWLVKEK